MKIYFGPSVGRSYEPDFINCVLKLLREPNILFRPQCNDALVSRSRSIAVSTFLKTDCDVFLSIDTDIVFKAEDALRLCEWAHERPLEIVTGLYAKRTETMRQPASLLLRGSVIESSEHHPRQIRYGATGFMAFSRNVVERMVRDLPLCHPNEKWAFYPLFMPFVANDDDGNPIYLSEDFAFCARGVPLGIRTTVIPDIRLLHVGPHAYTLADGPWRLTRRDEPGVKYTLETTEPVLAIDQGRERKEQVS